MDEKELERMNKEFFGFTVAQIDEDLGRYIIKYSNLLRKKQDLIKYLEDKNTEYDITANGMPPSSERDELIIKARAYREILDKIKEGNYE